MDRAQKAESIETLKGVFADAGSVVVTQNLGLTVAGWKGNGLVIHQPSVETLLAACESAEINAGPAAQAWQIKAEDPALRAYLHAQSVPLADSQTDDYIFHPIPR